MEQSPSGQSLGQGALAGARLIGIRVPQHSARRRQIVVGRGGDRPCSRVLGVHEDVIPLAGSQAQRVDSKRFHRPSIGMRDRHGMAADRKSIDRRTGRIDQSHSNAFPGFDVKNCGSLGGAPIDEQHDIRRREHLHHAAIGALHPSQGNWRPSQEVGQSERVLAIVGDVGVLLFHNQRTDQAAIRLQAEMRVVHVTSGRCSVEFIDESCARLNRGLRDVGDAVHRIVQRDAVPMYGRPFRQFVLYRQAQPLPFFCANLRPGELPVVQPLLKNSARRNFKLRWLRNQSEFPQRSGARPADPPTGGDQVPAEVFLERRTLRREAVRPTPAHQDL